MAQETFESVPVLDNPGKLAVLIEAGYLVNEQFTPDQIAELYQQHLIADAHGVLSARDKTLTAQFGSTAKHVG